MKRGDLVLTSDNYIGIIKGNANQGRDNEYEVFCGNGLTSLYPKSFLQTLHFKSNGTLLMVDSVHAIANFSEILKED